MTKSIAFYNFFTNWLKPKQNIFVSSRNSNIFTQFRFWSVTICDSQCDMHCFYPLIYFACLYPFGDNYDWESIISPPSGELVFSVVLQWRAWASQHCRGSTLVCLSFVLWRKDYDLANRLRLTCCPFSSVRWGRGASWAPTHCGAQITLRWSTPVKQARLTRSTALYTSAKCF